MFEFEGFVMIEFEECSELGFEKLAVKFELARFITEFGARQALALIEKH